MTHDDLLLLGERLRIKRSQLSFTQEYVSDKIGISLRFYQMIERGEKSMSLDTLIQLGKLLNISIDYLLLGDITVLSNPVAEIMSNLSPRQREDAIQILRLYADASRK